MKFLSDLIEAVALIILLPFILLFELLLVVAVFLFIASPLIFIGWLIWLAVN